MIYIVIAASYTPICLGPLRGAWGWSIFGVIWGFAVLGTILTAIWINSRNPIIFCMALVLSILIAGNRVNDTRTFAEVLFGAFMGMLIVLLVYGLTIFRI